MGETAQEPRPLRAEIEIAAPPAAVWAVVSDVRRTGEWSPECRRVRKAGPLLFGFNRRGRVRWVTVSRLTEAVPDQVISWVVMTNRSRWTYRLSPVDGGTRVEQLRETPRGEGAFALWFTRAFLGGQADHDDELEAGMAAGLRRIRAIVEAVPVIGSARADDPPRPV